MVHTSFSETSLKILYFDEDEILKLQIREQEITTLCEIKTLEAHSSEDDEIISFADAFKGPAQSMRGLIASERLREILAEFGDNPPATEISLQITKKPFSFSFSAHSDQIRVILSRSSFISMDIMTSKEKCEHTYRLSLLNFAAKCMSYSEKTLFEVNEEGAVCFQNMLIHEDGVKTYLNYYTLPSNSELDA